MTASCDPQAARGSVAEVHGRHRTVAAGGCVPPGPERKSDADFAANWCRTSEVLLFQIGLRYHGETSFPARRPSAGAVPGRCGACLAVRTPPAAFCSRLEIRC